MSSTAAVTSHGPYYRLRFLLASWTLALLAVILLVMGTAQAVPAAPLADIQLFEAFLTGPAEPNHPDTVATGRAVFALSEDESTLFYNLSVSDIVSVTASHIHIGAPGVGGPAAVDLLQVRVPLRLGQSHGHRTEHALVHGGARQTAHVRL